MNSVRILLVSDIHGNLGALETVLSNAPGHDAVWCLGDVVGYGPAPNECVARLRGLAALTLTGNHDQAVIGRLQLADFTRNARLALEWTRGVLSAENAAWLKERAPRRDMPEHDLTLVHASPRDPTLEYILDAQTAAENLPYFDTGVCLFGHTHRPIAYRLGVDDRVLRTELLPEVRPYALQPRLLLNPGSVGQPRDGDPRAAYALLDLTARSITHYRTTYDIGATQRAIRDAGLPEALAGRLERGL